MVILCALNYSIYPQVYKLNGFVTQPALEARGHLLQLQESLQGITTEKGITQLCRGIP